MRYGIKAHDREHIFTEHLTSFTELCCFCPVEAQGGTLPIHR